MPLLQDILILLVFSVVIVFVLQRLKLPSIIGFLLTGVIIGPYGLSLIKAVEQVEILSEVGVILLLFVMYCVENGALLFVDNSNVTYFKFDFLFNFDVHWQEHHNLINE